MFEFSSASLVHNLSIRLLQALIWVYLQPHIINSSSFLIKQGCSYVLFTLIFQFQLVASASLMQLNNSVTPLTNHAFQLLLDYKFFWAFLPTVWHWAGLSVKKIKILNTLRSFFILTQAASARVQEAAQHHSLSHCLYSHSVAPSETHCSLNCSLHASSTWLAIEK